MRVIRSVSIFEAKSQLSKMIDAVKSGEEIVITKHGKPVARLVQELPRTIRFGLLEGKTPDWAEVDFDEGSTMTEGFNVWKENLKELDL
jgi:prevent-host-death family protein